MSDRKAVVTTVQVQDALSKVNDNYKFVLPDWKDTEFDKGARGKGFAEYDQSGSVIRSFDTKEDALKFYTQFAAGQASMMVYLPKSDEKAPRKAAAKAAEKPAE